MVPSLVPYIRHRAACLLFVIYKDWLERQSEKRKRDFPLGSLVRCWARLKPRARNSIHPGLPLGCQGSKSLGCICCFPRCISVGLSQQKSSQDSNQCSNIRCQCPRWQLNLKHHNINPTLSNLLSPWNAIRGLAKTTVFAEIIQLRWQV